MTILEELKVLGGEVGPSDVILLDLVHQCAVRKGIDFYINYKTFDPEQFPKAQIYLDKILNVIRGVFRVDQRLLKSIIKLTVAIIGDSSHTWEAIQEATPEQWETFINDNILRTFELLDHVLQDEKLEYDNI